MKGKDDMAVAWFLQTFAFVAYNKVITSQVCRKLIVSLVTDAEQYFLWFLWFLPLVVPRLQMSGREAIILALLWIAAQVCPIPARKRDADEAQAIWLKYGYSLEMLGRPVYKQLWQASLLFMGTNTLILVRLLAALKHQTRLNKSG